MKRSRFLIALVLGLSLACPSYLLAAGSVTISKPFEVKSTTKTVKEILITWTADASDGSVPDTTIAATTYGLQGFRFYSATTDPGSTAPADNYDITLMDQDGVDVAGGLLMNRDASSSEGVFSGLSSVYAFPYITGNLTFNLDNNSVNSATGTCRVVFEKAN